MARKINVFVRECTKPRSELIQWHSDCALLQTTKLNIFIFLLRQFRLAERHHDRHVWLKLRNEHSVVVRSIPSGRLSKIITHTIGQYIHPVEISIYLSLRNATIRASSPQFRLMHAHGRISSSITWITALNLSRHAYGTRISNATRQASFETTWWRQL